MAFTAKVHVTGKTPNGGEQTTINFGASYENGANAEWAKWTPALTLALVVKNELAETIPVGQQYTLLFTEES